MDLARVKKPQHRLTDTVKLVEAVKTTLGFLTVCVLMIEGGLGALALAFDGIQRTYVIVGIFATLLFLISSALVIDKRDRDQRLQSPAQPSQTLTQSAIPTTGLGLDFDLRIRELTKNVAEAKKIGSKILDSEMLDQLNELAIETESWSNGKLRTPSHRYNGVLVRLYEGAQKSIFSTTNHEYLEGWSDELMGRMIDASVRSPAKQVTRVFLFSSRNQLDEHAIDVLSRFERESRIATKVFIFEESDAGLHPDVVKDFVVIDDGDAIGVTAETGRDRLAADWYFGDELRKFSFETMCSTLNRYSVPARTIVDWWNSQFKPHKQLG